MLPNTHSAFDQASDTYCHCSVCKNKPDVIHHNQTPPKNVNLNTLLPFLRYFPKNFPLPIVPTAFPKDKIFYENRQGNRLNTQPFSARITEHFPLATNVTLFYQNKITIAHKYQLMRQNNNYIYIQAYNPKIPVCVLYNSDDDFMDQVLYEKFFVLCKSLSSEQQSYTLSENERHFINWIHKEYEDFTFCKFMTKVYCEVIKNFHGDYIISGQFEWIVQKMGSIRLLNIKDLVLEKTTKTTTFQQQYEQKIRQKLEKKQPIQVKIINTIMGKGRINNRISVFRNQIRDIFNKQKNKILQKTEQQRTVQTLTESDAVARLFLPQLGQYSSLRQVLNDQKKFKKVVLGMEDEEQQKHKNTNKPNIRLRTTPKLNRKITSESMGKSRVPIRRQLRSKTEV